MYSFTKRKKTVDLSPYIRQLCDLTTPNLVTNIEGRSENRYNRTIPTLIVPWEDGRPLADEAVIGLTGDMSDRGLSLVLQQPFRADAVAVGYWISSDAMDEPWYFLGEIRRNQAIGGGFWKIGIELAEFANSEHVKALATLERWAETLRPPADTVVV